MLSIGPHQSLEYGATLGNENSYDMLDLACDIAALADRLPDITNSISENYDAGSPQLPDAAELAAYHRARIAIDELGTLIAGSRYLRFWGGT